MIKSYNLNLNKFFRKIMLKKQYIKQLMDKTLLLAHIKEQNYKNVHYDLFLKNQNSIKPNGLIIYIINISFSRSNASLHITDFTGALKFNCSAGNLSFRGKNKKARVPVLKAITRVLNKKLKMLQNKPIALHLKNVGFKRR
jgi:ribosomal protein S11